MAEGTLEVNLVSAKGLKDVNFLSGIDAYAILTCQSQVKRSHIAAGEGSNPEWNETFFFDISKGVQSLKIKIMDKDTFNPDDVIGEATISLRTVFEEGSIPPISYNIVKFGRIRGEVQVGLKFTKKARNELQKARNEEFPEENFGG